MNRRHFIKNTALSAFAFPAFYEKQDADVIIIGAGLSGLYAAMLLEKKGIKTLILEGNTRIGGRLWTKEIRPAAKDNFEVSFMNAWEQNPFSGGTYFELQAGQAAWFEYWTKSVNNLYFAGEHTALEARGMEAALESGERVVEQLKM
jgi:monoamine oxidase